MARVERQRQRQAMVNDFKFMLSIEGQSRPVLYELKVISCSKSRYKPSWTDRAVDRRAAALHQEYLDKARAADQQYGGVEQGRVGPVENKLISSCLRHLLPVESGWLDHRQAGRATRGQRRGISQ